MAPYNPSETQSTAPHRRHGVTPEEELPESFAPHAEAMVVSYLSVRRAIGVTGLLLPVVLWPGAWLLFGVPIQDNMSSYYHTPVRDVFVGVLCAMGIFLYCYHGHDWVENWTANLGCVAALGVALFPFDKGNDPLNQTTLSGNLHSVFGAALFLTLAFYSLVRFPSHQRRERETAPHEMERNLIYWGSGVVILASLAAMGVYVALPGNLKSIFNRYHFMFWMEWVALWAFAAAWLTKGRAIFTDLAVSALAIPTEFVRRRRVTRTDAPR